MRTLGTSAFGIRAPIIRENDDLCQIVVDSVLNSGIELQDRDVIGITESIVARAQGNYVTIDEVAEEIRKKTNNADHIKLYQPIYSRNRFAMILKAFARAAGKKVTIYMDRFDEVGNVLTDHPFTGLDYDEYYKELVEGEGKECEIKSYDMGMSRDFSCNSDLSISEYAFDVKCHPTNCTDKDCTLVSICSDKCEFGLFGSNKASEELLKLFPNKKAAQTLVDNIQTTLCDKTGKKVEVMVYGDGCFKDPVGGIWEFADPVVSPAYTSGLEGTPNELKLKNLADEEFKDLSGEELKNAIKNKIKNKEKDLVGNMASQGTTPRRITDLLGSLMDLMSGSGDKGTPIILVKGYFDNYTTE